MRKALLLIPLVVLPIRADGKKKIREAAPVSTTAVYLFEYSRNDSTLAAGALRANRVYVRFCPELSEWVFSLTDLHGKFPDPMEVLVAGSIVNGEAIGAPSGSRYVFGSGGRWLPTSDPRRQRFIVMGEIPSYKTVSYEPAGDARIEFVNPDYKLNIKTYDPFAVR